MVGQISRFVLLLVGLIVLAPFSAGRAAAETVKPSTCEDLEACLIKLETWELRDDYSGYMPHEIKRIGARLAQYGPEVVDRLLALLDHEVDEVRDRAAEALGYQETIHKKHLDALIKAHGNRVRNLPLPIMLTLQPEAVEYLLSHMRKDVEDGYTGLSDALARFPELTAVPMAEALSCKMPCPENMTMDIFFAFRFMDVVPMDVVPIFILQLNDPSVPEHATADLIAIVGEMGDRAGPITPDLVRLSWAEGRIGWAATRALLDLQHPSGIQPALKLMRKHGAVADFIGEIVDLGPIATQAGPAFTELLAEHTPWGDDFFYAWALGQIDYPAGVPALMAALESPDWLVIYHALEALSKVAGSQYQDKIEQLAERHYAPPVRSAARRNLEGFKVGRYPDDGVHGSEPKLTWGDTLSKDDTKCGPGHLERSGPVVQLRVSESLRRKPESELKIGILPRGIPKIEDTRPVSAAMKIRGGWLVGTDKGEWGGSLYYVDRKGNAAVLHDRNVFDIWRDREGDIYIATGVSHLGLYHGEVWRLLRKKRGGYTVEQVLRLFSAPSQTIRSDNDLVVITTWKGAVGLKGGKPVRVDCIRQDSAD